MDVQQYDTMRTHILGMLDQQADPGSSIALRRVVEAAQERYASHPLIPKGRVRNYCPVTKVHLEARCDIERIPGSSPQRITRAHDDPTR
jgi:hypothetical protein